LYYTWHDAIGRRCVMSTIYFNYKDSDMCVTLHCICGKSPHGDGYFMYAIQCPYCDRMYRMPTKHNLITVKNHPKDIPVIVLEKDDE
jgi:hypothetical protein